MVISPRTAHSFRVLVIRYDIGIVGELFVADGAFPVMLHNLPVQKLTHLCWRPVFDILAVVRIFDPLHSKSYQPRFGNESPATAGNRCVSGANFVWTESHGSSPGMPR